MRTRSKGKKTTGIMSQVSLTPTQATSRNDERLAKDRESSIRDTAGREVGGGSRIGDAPSSVWTRSTAEFQLGTSKKTANENKATQNSRSKGKTSQSLPAVMDKWLAISSEESNFDGFVLVQEPEDVNDRLDILCGPGISSEMVLSNCLYLQWICEWAAEFPRASSREKAVIASDIVEQVRIQNGRFLKKQEDSDSWVDIGNQMATAKTFRQLALAMGKEGCTVEDFLDKSALCDGGADDLAWAEVCQAFEENREAKKSNKAAVKKKTETKQKPGNPRSTAEDDNADETLRLSYERLLSTPQKNQLERLRSLKASKASDVKEAAQIITIPEQVIVPFPRTEETKRVKFSSKRPSRRASAHNHNRTSFRSSSKPSTKHGSPGNERPLVSTTPCTSKNDETPSSEGDIDLTVGVDTPESANDYPSPAPDGGWRHPNKQGFSQQPLRPGFLSPIKRPREQGSEETRRVMEDPVIPETPPPPPKIERKTSSAAQLLASDADSIPHLPSTDAAADARLQPLEYLAYVAEAQRSPFTVKKFLSNHPGALLNFSPSHFQGTSQGSAFSDVTQRGSYGSPFLNVLQGKNQNGASPLSDEELRRSLFSQPFPGKNDENARSQHEAKGNGRDGQSDQGHGSADQVVDGNDSSTVAKGPIDKDVAPPLAELNTSVSQDLCEMADDDNVHWYV